MTEGTSLDARAYSLARSIYVLTAMFPDTEKPLLGKQLRDSALDLATEAAVLGGTDDPSEREEMLRLAAMNSIRIRELLRLTQDLDHVPSDSAIELFAEVEAIGVLIARERRTQPY